MLRTSPSRPWRRSISALATLALAGVGVIAAAPAMATEPGAGEGDGDCIAAPATSSLTWNIKDSFIGYVTGMGSIEYTGGAENVDGRITWGAGTGALDASGSGTLAFPGSVHLSAHGGALDMTFSDLKVDTAAGTLSADIASKDMSGEDASVVDEVIATLEFSELGQSGGQATSVLTEAAAGAFGSYDAGEELAGLTISHTPAVECPTEPEPTAPSTKVSVVTATATAGLVVEASGRDYVELPNASSGQPAVGIYAALIDADALIGADDVSRSTLVGAVPVNSIADGVWQQKVTVSAADLDPNINYELVTWSAHGNLNENTLIDRTSVDLTEAQKDALFADDGDDGSDGSDGSDGDGDDGGEPGDLTTSAKVAKATADDGLVVEASGTGYLADALPTPIGSDGQPGRAMGFYAAIRDANTQSFDDINDDSAALIEAWIMPQQVRNGVWSTSLTVEAADIPAGADLELLTWSAHGVLTEDTLIATEPITLTADQRAALGAAGPGSQGPGSGGPGSGGQDAGNTGDTGNTGNGSHDPGANTLGPEKKPAAPAGPVVTCTTETIPATAGTPHLSWGVKSSFRTYIEGGIAKGTIATSNGAARGSGGFTWGTGSGKLNASGLGTVSFAGVVQFSGHHGVLNTRISNVRIKITGSSSGVLIADVKSQDMEGNDASATGVTFANLSFSSVSSAGGTASATLTDAGARAFSGFYNAGEALDRITISVSGATAERTVEVCYDADGNRVNADGTAYTGPDDGLASTGLGHGNDLLGLVAGLTLAGAVLLIARSRRTGRSRA